MSTPIKPQQPVQPVSKPAVPIVKLPGNKQEHKLLQPFLFDKENYMWMVIGVALIFGGFMLMSGGKSANIHEFHYDEIYSFTRITVAPIVVLLGFVVEVFAIMKKPKDQAKGAA